MNPFRRVSLGIIGVALLVTVGTLAVRRFQEMWPDNVRPQSPAPAALRPLLPTPPPEAQVAVRNSDGRSYDLDVDGLVREGRVTDDPFMNWQPEALFSLMTEQSRADVIANAMQRAGPFPNARALKRLAEFLIAAGPSSIPAIDARLARSRPDGSAAGLVAICEIEGTRAGQHGGEDAYETCFQERLEKARPAVERAVAMAAESLALTAPESVPCYWILRVLGAAGPAARPVLPALARLLDAGTNSETAAKRRGECSRANISATLVKILVPKPRDESLAALTDRAVDDLVAATLVRPDTLPQSAHLASVLDTVPASGSLDRRLETTVVDRLKNCDPIESERLLVLGRLGIGVLVRILDHWQDMGCPRDEWIRALALRSWQPAGAEMFLNWTLVKQLERYPDMASPLYDRTRSVFTRDHIVEAARVVVEPPEQQAAEERVSPPLEKQRAIATLMAFLSRIGYVAVAFTEEGTPRFPEASKLRWLPLDDRAIVFQADDSADAKARPDLRAALKRLAAATPGCHIPIDDEGVLLRSAAGKALFVFPCETGAPPQVVVGSRAGFKVMHFPARLSFQEPDAPDSGILAVSDVDGDGNLEILTRRRVCRDDPGCFEYDLSEESGDWFTHLTARR